jgi:hypothetical protein
MAKPGRLHGELDDIGNGSEKHEMALALALYHYRYPLIGIRRRYKGSVLSQP